MSKGYIKLEFHKQGIAGECRLGINSLSDRFHLMHAFREAIEWTELDDLMFVHARKVMEEESKKESVEFTSLGALLDYLGKTDDDNDFWNSICKDDTSCFSEGDL